MNTEPLCHLRYGNGPRVATLGDPLASTCSVDVARRWAEPREGAVSGFDTFEAAAGAVIAGQADVLLVPGAYPEIRHFIFEMIAAGSFIDEIPSIVLAGWSALPDGGEVRLFHHPALEAVVAEMKLRSACAFACELVTSNSVACERILADRQAWALTNEIAAEAYSVPVLSCLRPNRRMPFSFFVADLDSLVVADTPLSTHT